MKDFYPIRKYMNSNLVLSNQKNRSFSLPRSWYKQKRTPKMELNIAAISFRDYLKIVTFLSNSRIKKRCTIYLFSK